jgi:DNA polymerase III alpha subunit (gram-positive type)
MSKARRPSRPSPTSSSSIFGGAFLVAHNAHSETTFLRAELSRLGVTSPVDDLDALCTMKLAKTHLPGSSTKLADCCSALGIPLENAHEALADARTTKIDANFGSFDAQDERVVHSLDTLIQLRRFFHQLATGETATASLFARSTADPVQMSVSNEPGEVC